MPWKQGYTISDERSLADSEIRWPDGARCCVAVTVDLSVASGAEGITAADLATPEALFGANRGLAALREILRRRGMRATFAVPAVIAHIHCDLVRSLAAEGHEIAAHGFRHEDVTAAGRPLCGWRDRPRICRAAVDCLNQTYPEIGAGPSVHWAGAAEHRRSTSYVHALHRHD